MDISGVYFCSKCMRQIPEEEVCPYCGYDHRREENKSPALSRGTLLHGRYQLGSVIGTGGFGITYAAYDEVLQAPVAVKEYFPRELARRDTEESDDLQILEEGRGLYQVGAEHFIREARVLGMMKNMQGVVTVQDYFEENETAYIVMEFIRGITLDEYVKKEKVKPERLFEMLKAPIDALAALHRQGVLHRDITPSNLLVQEDGSAKLIDFGAAARMDRDQSMILVTKQYAPLEQYGTSGQAMGPWTDIYGLCATIYHMLTGKPPQDALGRARKDELVPLKKKELHLKGYQIRAVMAGLEKDPKKRPQSMEEFKAILYNTPMPEEIRLRRKILRQYVAVTGGIVLLALGIFWVWNVDWFPSNTLMDVNAVDFQDYSQWDDERWDAPVFGNRDYRRRDIASITFLDGLPGAGENAWDVSDVGDGSVLAWTKDNGARYDLYIGAEGGVKANPSCQFAFAGFNNAEAISFDGNFDTSQVTDMGDMFNSCTRLEELELSGFSTGSVTSMEDMFYGCEALEELELGSLDTAQVTNFSGMFSGCQALTALELGSLDTAVGEDFSRMFSGCKQLETLELGNFDTARATDFSRMFSNCRALTVLELENFDTSQATDFSGMFSGCEALRELELEAFETGRARDMGQMFQECGSLEKLDVSGFDTSVVTDMSEMFQGCGMLEEIDISGFDTSMVEDMSSMFEGCAGVRTLDLGGLNTSSLEDMHSMFEGCTSLEVLNLEGLDTSAVTSMYSMFADCSALTELDLSDLDTSQVTSLSSLFSGCEKLEVLTLDGLDTSSVDSMFLMFSGCASIRELDLSGFDTSAVTDMYGMFKDCAQLVSLNLEGFDTGKVETMSYMFDGCARLEELDLSMLDTSMVDDMSYMFQECASLSDLTLGEFANPRLEEATAMFRDCTSLTKLDLSRFGTSKIKDMSWMFYQCVNLISLNLEGWDTSSVTDMKYMFVDCASLTDLDLSGFDTSSLLFDEQMLRGTVWEGKELSQVLPLTGTLMDAQQTDFRQIDWEYGSGEDALVFGNTELTRDQIGSITFLDDTAEAGENAWDVSSTRDGSVLAWTRINGGLYDLYIAAEGGVKANASSRAAFAFFENVREISFNGCFDTSAVTDMSIFFYECNSLESLDLSGFDTSQVTTMRGMFENCSKLASVDLSGFVTDRVGDMAYLFYGCMALEEADLSAFDTAEVTDMSGMFYDCAALESLDVSGFDTGKTAAMPWMFYGCTRLSELDVSGFDTSRVTTMKSMFCGCQNLETLDISGFDTSRVTDMSYMFSGCRKLSRLKAGDFDLDLLQDATGIFDQCDNLKIPGLNEPEE